MIVKCHSQEGPQCDKPVVVIDHNLEMHYPLDIYYCAEHWGDHPLFNKDDKGRVLWEPYVSIK